jgi:capsular polysaccharide biosynthesis protein
MFLLFVTWMLTPSLNKNRIIIIIIIIIVFITTSMHGFFIIKPTDALISQIYFG